MLILKSVNFEKQHFHNHRLQRTYPGQNEWNIGRNNTCDLVLANPEISRLHGRIVYQNDTYYFVDLGSLSGSILNGKPVASNEQKPLHPGDLLQLGETFLYVEELSCPLPALSGAIAPALPAIGDPWEAEELICQCCRITEETPDVKTFHLRADPPLLFAYQPGQFVNLEVMIEGKPVLRSYSISSSPTRPYHLSLTVKRVPSPPDQPHVPAGLVSNWLHDHLQVGDRIKLIGGPQGHFTCASQPIPNLLLISAGSGITPMMSMARWAQDTLSDRDIVFLHSARTADDVIFRAELEAMAAHMPNFHLLITLTQQPMGRSWMGLTGRISEHTLHMAAPDFRDRAVYVCGPNSFMEGMKSLLDRLQFPMEHYQEESFSPPKRKRVPAQAAIAAPTTIPPVASMAAIPQDHRNGAIKSNAPLEPVAATQSIRVHFVKSQRHVEGDGETPLLEMAEQENIAIRHACRVGVCGACKVRVQQGQVRYDSPPSALTAADETAGYALSCVAYPVGQVLVEA